MLRSVDISAMFENNLMQFLIGQFRANLTKIVTPNKKL